MTHYSRGGPKAYGPRSKSKVEGRRSKVENLSPVIPSPCLPVILSRYLPLAILSPSPSPVIPSPYLRVILSPSHSPVIPSPYLRVILSPSPSPVILSAAKDLLSRFETLLPLRTGSAKDLLPCGRASLSSSGQALSRSEGSALTLRNVLPLRTGSSKDLLPSDQAPLGSPRYSKKCAGPGVTGPALRRGFEAVRSRQPASLELPVGYRSNAPDDPFESAEIVGRRHSLRKRRPRELKPKPRQQEGQPLGDTEGSTRFDIKAISSLPRHSKRR
jgi:hypothetical protein